MPFHFLLSPLPFSLFQCQSKEIMLRYQGLDLPSGPLPFSPSAVFCSSIQTQDPRKGGKPSATLTACQPGCLHAKRNNPHAILTHPSIMACQTRPSPSIEAEGGGLLAFACRAMQQSSYPDPTLSPKTTPLPKQAAVWLEKVVITAPSVFHSIPTKLSPQRRKKAILAPGSQPDIDMFYSWSSISPYARLLTRRGWKKKERKKELRHLDTTHSNK